MSEPAIKPAKQRFPRAVTLGVAQEICGLLTPCTERIIVAGSLRRRKEEVGDVEILYIPKHGLDRGDELFEQPRNLADLSIERMLRAYILKKRTNINGSEMYGPKNKLLMHTLTGVPVDLFEATAANWYNYLVCRTGGAKSNTLLAAEAKDRGYQWNPYGVGFTRLSDGEVIPMESEEAVFRFVGFKYREPADRA